MYQARVLQEQLVLIRYAEFQAIRVRVCGGIQVHSMLLRLIPPLFSILKGDKKIVRNSQKRQ